MARQSAVRSSAIAPSTSAATRAVDSRFKQLRRIAGGAAAGGAERRGRAPRIRRNSIIASRPTTSCRSGTTGSGSLAQRARRALAGRERHPYRERCAYAARECDAARFVSHPEPGPVPVRPLQRSADRPSAVGVRVDARAIRSKAAPSVRYGFGGDTGRHLRSRRHAVAQLGSARDESRGGGSKYVRAHNESLPVRVLARTTSPVPRRSIRSRMPSSQGCATSRPAERLPIREACRRMRSFRMSGGSRRVSA